MDGQKSYTVTKKEPLSIVEALKKFITRLICRRAIIYTDHKNLMCKNFNTNRLLR